MIKTKFPAYDNQDILNALQTSVKDGKVLFDKQSLFDYSNNPKSSNEEVQLPIAIVLAKSIEDILAVVKVARQFHTPIITKDTNTSVVGGSRGQNDSIVLSLAEMNQILEINPEDGIARVQAGVINGDLDKAVSKYGFFYAPDPGSKNISSIGGNVSTNAGGMQSVRYGVTKDQVLGMKVVLMDGRVIELGGRTLKQAFSYDLTHLFVGSEGTLGIIVEITVKILPIPLGTPLVGIANFKNMTELTKATGTLRSSGVYPTVLEALDAATVQKLDEYESTNYSKDNAAMLIFRLDFTSPEIENKVNSILQDFGATNIDISSDPKHASELFKLRNDMLPAIFKGNNHVMEDMSLPLSKMAEMMDYISDIAKKYNLKIYVAGHAGDGNVHPSFVWDINEKQTPIAINDAIKDIFNKTLELGGVISGEHAVGTQKNEWNYAQNGFEGDYLQHQIKSLLDPMNLLNPGVKIL
ncbi:MAG: FAD-binding protein [Lactobacillaceae bacterium]|jgi:glycolate oxidase|nr:FAD-binding protein [Lactobacillaceae bacterium]